MHEIIVDKLYFLQLTENIDLNVRDQSEWTPIFELVRKDTNKLSNHPKTLL